MKTIDDMEEVGILSEDLKEERMSLRIEFAEVVRKESCSWRQKAKVKWAMDGDCNFSFFHRVSNGRRSKNLINSLMNDRGEVVRGKKEIEEEMLSSFTTVYGPPIENKPFVEGVDWSSISDQERSFDSLFLLDEIKRVVFKSNRNKSPNPDGFSMGFF